MEFGVTLTRKIIGMNSILYELAESVFVYVNATSLSMMNVTFDNCWVGARFHFESSDSVIVDVILLEITLTSKNKTNRRHTVTCAIAMKRLTMPLSNVNMPTSRPWCI